MLYTSDAGCAHQVLRAMRAKASHAAADGSGRAYTVVQEAAELTALRDN